VNAKPFGGPDVAKRNDNRWSSEAFLRDACDAMAEELDWDTIDSGCLHRASCAGRTLDGRWVVVAVLDTVTVLSSVLDDVQTERLETGRNSAVLWLYVPKGLELPPEIEEDAHIRRVGSRARKGRRAKALNALVGRGRPPAR
jgi:hypothetical protein